MCHNKQTATLLIALGAATSATAARSDYAVPKTAAEESWDSPARETRVADARHEEPQVALGWTPKPTPGPQHPRDVLGRMLMPRQDDFTLGARTCGFVPNKAGHGLTCVDFGYTCTPLSGFVGCCESSSACSAIKTACINYSSSKNGGCNNVLDDRTVCCDTSTVGECFTWIIKTSASTDDGTAIYTLLDCASQPGTGSLLTYDPSYTKTHTVNPTDSTTISSTSTSAISMPTDTSGGDNGPPVGAIAGGAVGGVAVIVLAVVAFFLIRRRSRSSKNDNNNNNGVTIVPENAAKMSDTSSPPTVGGMYPPGALGVYQQQQSPQSPPSGHDPRTSQYSHPGGYQHPFAGQQQQPGFQGQYPQQQYGYSMPLGSTSPPPLTTPSSGIAMELDGANQPGAESNRAELAS